MASIETAARSGASCHSRFRAGIGVQQLSETGTELAVRTGTPNLEQEIGAVAGPARLLRFVDVAVDQEVGGAFGERGAEAVTGGCRAAYPSDRVCRTEGRSQRGGLRRGKSHCRKTDVCRQGNTAEGGGAMRGKVSIFH